MPDDPLRRTGRFNEQEVLPALRVGLSQRPEWRGFFPHQLSVVLFPYGYLPTPLSDFDVEAMVPFALEDRAGAA